MWLCDGYVHLTMLMLLMFMMGITASVVKKG